MEGGVTEDEGALRASFLWSMCLGDRFHRVNSSSSKEKSLEVGSPLPLRCLPVTNMYPLQSLPRTCLFSQTFYERTLGRIVGGVARLG